ncbi:MAG: sulfur carrier protein ThiS [Firmicutes bacterium]|nr:sulfur carrier protein ThiS [Bacillota bacterium]
MIKLNNRDYPYREGLTVRSLMDENGFVFQDIVVKINGKVVRDEAWSSTVIHDEDDVQMIHIFGGG